MFPMPVQGGRGQSVSLMLREVDRAERKEGIATGHLVEPKNAEVLLAALHLTTYHFQRVLSDMEHD